MGETLNFKIYYVYYSLNPSFLSPFRCRLEQSPSYLYIQIFLYWDFRVLLLWNRLALFTHLMNF